MWTFFSSFLLKFPSGAERFRYLSMEFLVCSSFTPASDLWITELYTTLDADQTDPDPKHSIKR